MTDEAPSTQSSAPKREGAGGPGKQEGRGGGPKRSGSLRGGPQRPHSSTSNREGSDKEQLHRNASGSRGKQANRGRGNGSGRGGGNGGGRKGPGPNNNNKNSQGGSPAQRQFGWKQRSRQPASSAAPCQPSRLTRQVAERDQGLEEPVPASNAARVLQSLLRPRLHQSHPPFQ